MRHGNSGAHITNRRLMVLHNRRQQDGAFSRHITSPDDFLPDEIADGQQPIRSP